MTASVLTTLSVFAAIIMGYLYLDYRKEKREWRKRVNRLYNDGAKRKSTIVLLGDRFDQSEMASPLHSKLTESSLSITPSEYIVFQFVAWMGLIMLLNNFFSITFPMNIIIALLILEGSKRIFFLYRKSKMKEKMVEQLPEICRTLANGTRSGMTLTQSINLVAQEVSLPAKVEFKRMANELALGIDFNVALKSMEKRIDSREFRLFVATLLIQKKAGGNLFAVLDEMGQTLEERKILLQEIKTMTAEQRYVAYIVPVIPIFLVLMMNNVIDGFLDPLFTGIGAVLFALFLAGTVLTFVLVRKVTNIRV